MHRPAPGCYRQARREAHQQGPDSSHGRHRHRPGTCGCRGGASGGNQVAWMAHRLCSAYAAAGRRLQAADGCRRHCLPHGCHRRRAQPQASPETVGTDSRCMRSRCLRPGDRQCRQPLHGRAHSHRMARLPHHGRLPRGLHQRHQPHRRTRRPCSRHHGHLLRRNVLSVLRGPPD